MKKISLLFTALLISGLLLSSFWEKQVSPAPEAAAVPQLLERHHGLGSADEQAFVQQKYQQLKKEVESQPQRHQAYIDLAHLYMMEARVTGEHGHYYPAALKMAKYVEENSQSKDMRFQSFASQASIYLSLHQFRQALKVAHQARKLNPHNALNYGALVDAYVELGEYEKAVEMADKMVSIRPDLRSYARVSYLREIHGQVEGALEAMEMARAAALSGSEEAAWCSLTLGKLYAKYGQTEKAEATFKTLLLERPNYPFAMAELGKLAKEKGAISLAEMYFKEAIALIPEVSFYQELAILYQQTGNKREARRLSREILEMLADDEAHGHKMTLAYAEVYNQLLNDQDQALSYATEAFDQRPENIEVNGLLARIYLAQGQPQKAQNHLDIAKRTGSQDPQYAQLSTQIQTAN